MPLTIPARKSVVQALRAYFLTAVPEWDTSTLRRSYVGGIVKALGSSLHDWYVSLKAYADKEPFPQTATGSFLTGGWWADITHLSPNPASPAQGKVVITGVAGTAIPTGTQLTANALTYYVNSGVSIVTQAIAAASLTSSGGVATFTSMAAHMLATGMTVVISGAAQSAYNGSFSIIVISDTSFIYSITSTPASPATGAPILATATYANADITCVSTGVDGNLDGGATLSLASVSGADDTAIVTYGSIGGGAASEDMEAYRQRILFALGSDFGAFTGDEIEIVTRQVPGVTRVWVRKAEVDPAPGWPLEGQVFVAFMRDGETNPFPTSAETATVKAAILENCMTANTAEEDVVVSSPTPLPVDFAFTDITPSTPSMRAAIKASLVQFFREGVDYGVSIPEDDYRCAIRDTYDPTTRTRLKSFTLSAPSGVVAVNYDELPVLGEVSF